MAIDYIANFAWAINPQPAKRKGDITSPMNNRDNSFGLDSATRVSFLQGEVFGYPQGFHFFTK
jgi:hypothetical protein